MRLLASIIIFLGVFLNLSPASASIRWKGYDWDLRSGGTGEPGFGGWSSSNVSGPDANGYLTLKLTNPTGSSPVGAEMVNQAAGLGYGTYTAVVGTRLDTLDKNVVFGGMFPFYYGSPYIEFDVNETSKWDVPASNVLVSHNLWYGSDPDNPIEHGYNQSIPSDVVQTHRLIWEPGRATFDSFLGTGTAGTTYFHTVITQNVPVPSKEQVIFNLWAYADGTPGPDDKDVPATNVILRDFSFIPRGSTSSTYALTVNGGSGSGSYAPGAKVSIVANAPASGKFFDKWTGSTSYLSDVHAAATSLTMPSSAIAVTANYGTGSASSPSNLIFAFASGDTRSSALAASLGINSAMDYGNSGWSDISSAGLQIIDDKGDELTQKFLNGASSDAALSEWTSYLKSIQNDTRLNNFWMLDDWSTEHPDSAKTLLQRMNALLHQYKPGAKSICGIVGNIDSSDVHNASSYAPYVANFSPQGCDMVAVYLYPIAEQQMDVVPSILQALKNVGWNPSATPLIGISLSCGNVDVWKYVPTAAQVENQTKAWCQYGATGLGFYDFATSANASTNSAIQQGIKAGIADCKAIWSKGTADSFTLTVDKGSGDGAYPSGTRVVVTADPAPSGQVFDRWTGDIGYLSSAYTLQAELTMPSKDAAITAVYKEATVVRYALTVNGGSGSGSYASGQQVIIVANAPATGKVFDRWTGNTGYVSSAVSSSATVTMPSSAIALTATYKTAIAATGALTATLLANQVATAQQGDNGLQLVSYRIANTGTEDLFLTGIRFTGDFSPATIKGVTLYINGRNVGAADSLRADAALFDTLQFLIVRGESFTFTLKGNIANASLGSRTYTLDKTSVVAKGMSSGKNAAISVIGGGSTITIAAGLVDGAIFRAYNDIDVYIVKIKNGKTFKRLILSPSVFRSYQHLRWENIIVVDRSVLDSYTTSDLVRVAGQTQVWRLEPRGDMGIKTRVTGSYEADSVYEINATDFASYL